MRTISASLVLQMVAISFSGNPNGVTIDRQKNASGNTFLRMRDMGFSLKPFMNL